MSFGRLVCSLCTCGNKGEVYDLMMPNNGVSLISVNCWREGRLSFQTYFLLSMSS